MATGEPSSGSSNGLWHYDDRHSATFTLPDGRKLGYAEYGAPNGQPILYFHGFPGCRIEAANWQDTGSKLGARIIAIDRPGLGLSSPHKNRTLLNHIEDVEALTDHLKLEKYGVLGISGGGPYALAAAKALPLDRLRAVSIVCGLGSPDMGYWGMNWSSYLGWTLISHYLSAIVGWYHQRDPVAQIHLSDEERVELVREKFEKDKKKIDSRDLEVFRYILESTERMRIHLRRGVEVFRNGPHGVCDDFRVLGSDFGFEIQDIRKDLPVHVWHGTDDVFVPLQHGQKVVERIGGCARLTVTSDTHASISFLRKEEYMGDLVRAVEGSSGWGDAAWVSSCGR